MKDFKLKTKNDVAVALLDTIRPLKKFYSEGGGWLQVGNIGVHYGEKSARMEGFTRVAWGLGPLWAGQDDLSPEVQKEAEEWRELYLRGIINSTNPEHPEYWGKPFTFDQKLVEMAALVTGISLCPERLWEPLTQEQKDNVYNYLNHSNSCELHPNNWRYFRILVNMCFRVLGLPYDAKRLEDDRALIESCYMGEGWYYDGRDSQIDYYIPFAMHFYSLIYAKFMEKEEPEHCAKLKERAVEFADDFVYWFAKDGNEIPYGRSLTYRFAHCCYFGAMGLAGIEGKNVDFGIMRRLTLRNIENWLNRPIFDNAGVMSVGYGYPNQFMTERYNAAGSPYWAFKAFIMLALPNDHAFWTTPEKDFEYLPQKCLKQPRMLITHDDNDHVLAYPTAQRFGIQGKGPHKYEKFVYSNQFAFSVSRESDIIGGAWDNTFVASLAGELDYRMRHGNEGYEVSEDCVKTNYRLIPGVHVQSVIVPCGAWHVRLHKVKTEHEIDVLDGGFSIEAERCFNAISGDASGKYTPEELHIDAEKGSAFAILPWGISGVVSVTDSTPIITDCMPNTNLLYNTSILPMSRVDGLKPGEHTIITCVFGDRSEKASELMKNVPTVEAKGDKFVIKANGKEVTVDFLAKN